MMAFVLGMSQLNWKKNSYKLSVAFNVQNNISQTSDNKRIAKITYFSFRMLFMMVAW